LKDIEREIQEHRDLAERAKRRAEMNRSPKDRIVELGDRVEKLEQAMYDLANLEMRIRKLEEKIGII